jgi:outer membrane receptor protein involved in Fe transport
MPYKGWALDIDNFHTQSYNFLDHGNVNYVYQDNVVTTNIFLPLTTQYALIEGWELTLRSPRLWHRGEMHLAYSNQVADFMGAITGGLTNFAVQVGYAPLDHDQRNTLNVGYDVTLPWRSTFSGNVYYGSGFTNGNPPPDYLPGHTTVDFTLAKSFGERFSVSANALNVTNSHLLMDNSFTFGGVHFNDPREIYGEFRYHFHY